MTEAEMINRLSELAEIVESSYDAIVRKEIDGTITFLNAAASRIYGYAPDEIVGKSIEILEPPERRGEIQGLLAKLKRGQRIVDAPTTRMCKDGTRVHIRVTINPVIEEGVVTGAWSVARDMTETRRLEEAFQQSQKMEAIGRLAGGIAHDFNNLLVVIRGNAQLLAERVDGEPRAFVEQIERASERATRLTRQLLAFSRQRVLRPEAVGLNDVVEGMLSLLRPLLPESIAIETDFADGLGDIDADFGELENAILNLAINARDAMPDGGTLQIRTAVAEVADKQASGQFPPGRFVLLQITDSGCGMDEETRERAFDPFFTTKSDGTGLGLSAVYGLVKQSDGFINLYSERGVGTTFRLYFPVTSTVHAAAEPASEPRPLEGTETILVVEDNEMVRELAATGLERLGYDVLAVASGEDAVALSESRPGTIDLLLTDVIMPGMNGREVAEKLLAGRPTLRVLYTSGYPADTILRLGIADSSAAFIEKPYLPDELARAVRDALDREQAA